MPSVHWVTRSLTKLSRIRGENCIEASVSVISRIAKTIDTTVMIEAAIVASTMCATWGSAWDGNSTLGTQALTAGTVSSSDESTAPARPSAMEISSGRTRKPPRSAYMALRSSGNDPIISLTSAAGLGYVVQVAAFGNETQFQFQGSISQLKPWRDWGIELMNCTLGYFLFEFGALKVGIRFDAVPTSAFTAGNMLYQSLSLSPCKESLFGGPTDIDYLKVFFADMNLQFQENFAEYEDKDHEGFRGRPGAPLTSTMRSAGCSTLSQGLRIDITRQREESGGILRPDLSSSAKYIEWANYLDATFKTTILALGTEAGQVLSITNPIVATYPGPPPPIPPATLPTNSNPSGPFPASTWPFRIIRWTLH